MVWTCSTTHSCTTDSETQSIWQTLKTLYVSTRNNLTSCAGFFMHCPSQTVNEPREAASSRVPGPLRRQTRRIVSWGRRAVLPRLHVVSRDSLSLHAATRHSGAAPQTSSHRGRAWFVSRDGFEIFKLRCPAATNINTSVEDSSN